jgi:YbbR domain-containing protein
MKRPEALVRIMALAPRAWASIAANAALAVVAVALSVLLWIAVTNEENPTLRRDVPFEVPVQEANVPRAFVVSGLNPNKVSVTLVGPRDRVTNVKQGDLSVQVNLGGASTSTAPTDGPLRFAAPAEVVLQQRGVRAEVAPASIEVTLEPEVHKVVPIRPNPVDALPVGFELTEPPVAQPAEATIAGTRQNVDLVDAVVADVRMDGLTANVSLSASLDPRDAAGHPIGHVTVDPPRVPVTVKVRQVLYSRQILLDPRVRGRPAPGYGAGGARAEPATVGVVGSIEALNQVSTLPTQEVDVEGAASDVVRTVGIQLPPGLTATDPKGSVVVRVPIQALSGPGAIGAVVRATGLGSNVTVIGQTPTVLVNVVGPLPTLLRLGPADVVVTVDASGLGAGIYRLEPKVALPAGIQLESTFPDRVSLTLVSSSIPR